MFWRRFGAGRPDATDRHRRQWYAAIVFAIGLSVATAGLVWFAYVATREWRRGTDLLQERQASEALALAHAAIIRDMKGAWLDLIVPINDLDLEAEPPYDLMQHTAQTFAKFPYPESVIIWKGDSAGSHTYVFDRSDRQPHWDHSVLSNDPFPVVMLGDPPAVRPVIEEAHRAAVAKRPFAVFDTTIVGVPYQIVARLTFNPQPPHELSRMVALTVNLDWVRHDYFGPLLSQIARIGGAGNSLPLVVMDDAGAPIAMNGLPNSGGSPIERRFPFVFLEPNMVRAGSPQRDLAREFTLRVYGNSSDATQAGLAASRTVALIAIAAIASVIALLQTVRAVSANVRLASMKSDFVSAVTHELKTPVATVRLVGDTLARGRYAPEAVQEYAGLLSQEASRLTHAIDQLLTYSHYADIESPRDLKRESIDLIDLVDDAVDRFRPALAEAGFTTSIDVSRDLPSVSVEPRAVTQVLEIVLDNAIKYSGDARSLEVGAKLDGRFAHLTVTDHGIGIHPDDIAHVCERFFRGRNARESGSGLGLAIARRIMTHHGGDLRVRSVLGKGTEVDVLVPLAG
jgi:signal transduction histidine kinase